jgi:hypothetical protein
MNAFQSGGYPKTTSATLIRIAVSFFGPMIGALRIEKNLNLTDGSHRLHLVSGMDELTLRERKLRFGESRKASLLWAVRHRAE